MLQITEFATRQALMQATAERIADALTEAIDKHGNGCAALSGGSTPEPAYRLLAEVPSDWDQITFALVDERFVPPSHTASNERMIETALTLAFRRGAQFKPMFSATENVEQAADQADAIYQSLRIDIALMGMGGDGHTASWFPGVDSEALQSERSVIAVHAPQAAGSAERLTLTRSALSRVGRLILLITGADKRARLERAVAAGDAPVADLFSLGMPPIEVLWAA